eukprot:scaffold4387_cov400-Prasinococcus_capsulatus_cf.AAC.6
MASSTWAAPTPAVNASWVVPAQVCQTGKNSIMACDLLRNMGYQKVAWVNGGFSSILPGQFERGNMKVEGDLENLQLASVSGVSGALGYTREQAAQRVSCNWTLRERERESPAKAHTGDMHATESPPLYSGREASRLHPGCCTAYRCRCHGILPTEGIRVELGASVVAKTASCTQLFASLRRSGALGSSRLIPGSTVVPV